jgi:AraC family transcriptional regulator
MQTTRSSTEPSPRPRATPLRPSRARKRSATLAPWQALRVSAHIEVNLDRVIRVSELAQIARLSPRYFSGAFRGSFGQSPYTYLLARRVRHACELMVGTSEPLSQIALSCGFSDQAHLSHVFRARIGISPYAWRRVQPAIAAKPTPPAPFAPYGQSLLPTAAVGHS